MNEQRYETVVNKSFRPYGVIPNGAFDVDAYVEHMPDNLMGPLRMFRSAMLDLGTLTIPDPAQRKMYRNQVFDRCDEMMGLMGKWIMFYDLDCPRILDEIAKEIKER